jgi:hypothetical protein
MTSVSGHMTNFAFPICYKGWNSVSPESLFSAPLDKKVNEKMLNIKKNLIKEAKVSHFEIRPQQDYLSKFDQFFF